jgi:hypothetical protein
MSAFVILAFFTNSVSTLGKVSIFIHAKVESWFLKRTHLVYLPVKVSITRFTPFRNVSRFALSPEDETAAPGTEVYVVLI